MIQATVVDLYERHARAYDRDRGRALQERGWLDRLGEPIARYFIERGHRVVGIDSSPSMIEMCRARFPGAEWLVADMRRLEPGRRFGGVVPWMCWRMIQAMLRP